MSSSPKTVNPFEIVMEQIDAVCDRLGVDDIYRSRLKKCERELIVNFPVRMDDGTVKVFTGFRVQHNDTRGPAKGGIRYHPDVTLDKTRALAVWMTLKRQQLPTYLTVVPRELLSVIQGLCPKVSWRD